MGISPAELIFGRRLHSQFDNIRPSLEKKANLKQEHQKKAHDSHARHCEFNVGDLVYVKNYGAGASWLSGKVIKKVGSTWYAVLLTDGRNIRKHADKMRSQVESTDQSGSSVEMNSNDLIDM